MVMAEATATPPPIVLYPCPRTSCHELQASFHHRRQEHESSRNHELAQVTRRQARLAPVTLSATGSRNAPKLDEIFHLLARYLVLT
eukprot:453409-Hanusia_phi.AAC.1